MSAALRFRVAGIPIRVEAAFILVVGLLGWSQGRPILVLVWVGIAFASVLVHELGHAVVGRRFGERPEIVLHGMLGYTVGSGAPLSQAQNIVVHLAGSLAGMVVLGFPALVLTGLFLPPGALELARVAPTLVPLAWVPLGYLAWINVTWSVVNLLPVLPFDGGRIAATLLDAKMGDRGRGVAHVVSIVIAALSAIWAVRRGGPYWAILPIIVVGWNIGELSELRDRPLRERVGEAFRLLRDGDPGAAEKAAESVLSHARSRTARDRALEVLFWAHIDQQHLADARATLARLPRSVPPPALAAAYLALLDEDREGALAALVRGLLQDPHRRSGGRLVARMVEGGIVDDLVDRLLASEQPIGLQATHTLLVDLHVNGRFAESARVGRRIVDDGRFAQSWPPITLPVAWRDPDARTRPWSGLDMPSTWASDNRGSSERTPTWNPFDHWKHSGPWFSG